MDVLAVELGIDPVELRRRNYHDPAAFPLTTPMGADYDSGDYELALGTALRWPATKTYAPSSGDGARR